MRVDGTGADIADEGLRILDGADSCVEALMQRGEEEVGHQLELSLKQ